MLQLGGTYTYYLSVIPFIIALSFPRVQLKAHEITSCSSLSSPVSTMYVFCTKLINSATINTPIIVFKNHSHDTQIVESDRCTNTGIMKIITLVTIPMMMPLELNFPILQYLTHPLTVSASIRIPSTVIISSYDHRKLAATAHIAYAHKAQVLIGLS